MKTIIAIFFIATSIASAYDADSMGRKAASIINEERRRIGVDTLEYQSDTFCIATDWADSTHNYFNVQSNPFSRDAAHRGCDERVEQYETLRNREWRYFGECVAMGKIRGRTAPVEDFTTGLLGSKDHYKVLMKKGYKKIIVGVVIKDGFFNMVVFTTAEFE